VDRLRASFSNPPDAQRLAIGLLETNEGEALLLFRQAGDECALFFTVAHQRHGHVVNLITQRWALYNRNASPEQGRIKSDEEFAVERGVPNPDAWRARPEWGALGYWHLVDYICHRAGHAADTPTPYTAAHDSELDYYEKIVHIETVKEALQRQPAALPSSQGSAMHHASPPTEHFL
jgi:hypothetical protein